MTFIQEMINKFKQQAFDKLKQASPKIKSYTAVGLMGATILSSLTACGNNTTIKDTELDQDGDKISITERITDNRYTNIDNSVDFTDAGVSTSKPPVETENNYSKYEHSDTFYRAQKRWNGLWHNEPGFDGKKIFLYSPAPFKFLNERGIVYYNQNGEPRVYGVDDDFGNELAIQGRGFIDEKTEDNDFYLIVQCVCGDVALSGYNDDVAVYTAFLKYSNLPDDLYRDLILYYYDCGLNLLIQQMDEDGYTPEILSESLVDFNLIKNLGAFRTENGYDQDLILSEVYTKAINFIGDINYEGDPSITVYYTDAEDLGKIYSYTYKLKETPGWESCLVDTPNIGYIPQEYRDSLTNDQIMKTYTVNAGKVLYECEAGETRLKPGEEQKATATLKYDLTSLGVNHDKFNTNTADYEHGDIEYWQVNPLTRAYEQSKNSTLTK